MKLIANASLHVHRAQQSLQALQTRRPDDLLKPHLVIVTGQPLWYMSETNADTTACAHNCMSARPCNPTGLALCQAWATSANFAMLTSYKCIVACMLYQFSGTLTHPCLSVLLGFTVHPWQTADSMLDYLFFHTQLYLLLVSFLVNMTQSAFS